MSWRWGRCYGDLYPGLKLIGLVVCCIGDFFLSCCGNFTPGLQSFILSMLHGSLIPGLNVPMMFLGKFPSGI